MVCLFWWDEALELGCILFPGFVIPSAMIRSRSRHKGVAASCTVACRCTSPRCSLSLICRCCLCFLRNSWIEKVVFPLVVSRHSFSSWLAVADIDVCVGVCICSCRHSISHVPVLEHRNVSCLLCSHGMT